MQTFCCVHTDRAILRSPAWRIPVECSMSPAVETPKITCPLACIVASTSYLQKHAARCSCSLVHCCISIHSNTPIVIRSAWSCMVILFCHDMLWFEKFEALRCSVCHCKPNQIMVQYQYDVRISSVVPHTSPFWILFALYACLLILQFWKGPRQPGIKAIFPGCLMQKRINSCGSTYSSHVKTLSSFPFVTALLRFHWYHMWYHLHIAPVQVVWGAQSTRVVVIHLAALRPADWMANIVFFKDVFSHPVMSLFKKRCRNSSPWAFFAFWQPKLCCQCHWSHSPSQSPTTAHLRGVSYWMFRHLLSQHREDFADLMQRREPTASGICMSMNRSDQAANDIVETDVKWTKHAGTFQTLSTVLIYCTYQSTYVYRPIYLPTSAYLPTYPPTKPAYLPSYTMLYPLIRLYHITTRYYNVTTSRLLIDTQAYLPRFMGLLADHAKLLFWYHYLQRRRSGWAVAFVLAASWDQTKSRIVTISWQQYSVYDLVLP